MILTAEELFEKAAYAWYIQSLSELFAGFFLDGIFV